MDPFNKEILLAKLKELAPNARVAFAAACATRLLPCYISIHRQQGSRDPLILSTALNACWAAASGETVEPAKIEAHLATVMQLIQSESSSQDPCSPYAEDAAGAVAYALRAVSENVEEPVWAAQRMYEAVTRCVRLSEKINSTGPALIEALNQTALVQREFSRQFRDLDELSKWSVEAVEIVRLRANAEYALPDELPIPMHR